MNRHDRQLRDDLAMRLYVEMVTGLGYEFHTDCEQDMAWRHRATLMADECLAWAEMFMEERAMRDRGEDEDERPRTLVEQEVEL